MVAKCLMSKMHGDSIEASGDPRILRRPKPDEDIDRKVIGRTSNKLVGRARIMAVRSNCLILPIVRMGKTPDWKITFQSGVCANYLQLTS